MLYRYYFRLIRYFIIQKKKNYSVKTDEWMGFIITI
jgi:hypothetical protein